ncbi:MAG: hypothetical protein JWM21_397 [Acidobacteria bacterium]|nr:hypothetical protein [Acidobacteriota bacterium]
MAAGAIPVSWVIRTFLPAKPPYQTSDFVIWFVLVPLLVTGFFGSLLGGGILDSSRKRSLWEAALRGLSVAVLAYLSSAILISIWEANTNQYGRFIEMLFMILLVGSMAIGWLIVVVGVMAGLLLFQLAEYLEKKSRTS